MPSVYHLEQDGVLFQLVAFYAQRAGAENLIKEVNNDAGLAAHPSGRWMMNCNWFQIAMLAFHRLMDRVRGIALGGFAFLGVEDGTHVNTRTWTTGSCIRFYAALPKHMWQSGLAMPNNQCRSSKGKKNQN